MKLRRWSAAAALCAVLALSGCAGSLDAVPPIADTASFIDSSQQVIKPGDSVRVVVFGNDAVSGTYTLGKDGTLKLASLGGLPASGLTPAELEQKIATRLAEQGVDNPQVSVVID